MINNRIVHFQMIRFSEIPPANFWVFSSHSKQSTGNFCFKWRILSKFGNEKTYFFFCSRKNRHEIFVKNFKTKVSYVQIIRSTDKCLINNQDRSNFRFFFNLFDLLWLWIKLKQAQLFALFRNGRHNQALGFVNLYLHIQFRGT